MSKKTATPKKEKPSTTGKTTAKLQELSFVRMIPNLATIMALCTGLSSIRFALMDKFELALIAIIIAAFLDGIDGRIARLLKATSDFGAELDSLSDFICFGVGPGVVIYLLSTHELAGFGWGVTLFYTVCMGLRLARFNVMNIVQKHEQIDEKIKQSPIVKAGVSKFFVGTPAPAAAFIAMLPLMINLAFGIEWILSPYVYMIFVYSCGLYQNYY